MTSAEKKELATEFLSEFEDPDPVRLATMVANDFECKKREYCDTNHAREVFFSG